MSEKVPKSRKSSAIIILALTVATGWGWGKYYAESRATERTENARLIADYLSPMITLLKRNGILLDQLDDSYLVPGLDAHESYVEKVGDDGFEVYARTKARILEIDRNNDEIVVLLRHYSGHALTEEFAELAKAYEEHAASWGDRWNEVAEAITTGKTLPEAKPFPEGFRRTLRRESDSRKDIR